VALSSTALEDQVCAIMVASFRFSSRHALSGALRKLGLQAAAPFQFHLCLTPNTPSVTRLSLKIPRMTDCSSLVRASVAACDHTSPCVRACLYLTRTTSSSRKLIVGAELQRTLFYVLSVALDGGQD
jgi:hypothetical protein